MKHELFIIITPAAGSTFRPLSQTTISKREFKNGHISRFCFVFQVIQVISSAKFFSAEEVDFSFNSKTKEHPQISKPSFYVQCSNLGRNESAPQTQSNVSWISSKAELEISFMKTRLEMRVWESGRVLHLAFEHKWNLTSQLDKLYLSSWLVTLASGPYSNNLTSYSLSSQLAKTTCMVKTSKTT